MGVIKKIFKKHWNQFIALYSDKIRKTIFREVEKMLECGSLEKGFIEFKCEACGETKRVGFRCKSRFCTSCGKIRCDDWAEEMTGRLINIGHRHMVFTIPKELRKVFAEKRELLALIPQCASRAVISWFQERNKKEAYMPGIVAVIHTFGRDLKWNPHVHMLVTEGGEGNVTIFKKMNYINYEALRKRWQKLLLDEIELEMINKKKWFRELKNNIYKKTEEGFYVYAKGIVKTAEAAFKYVGRYAARPAIAESRIIKYDGKKVTFYYERHEDGKRVEETIDAIDFIGKLIRHIPEKGFKMIRYYGIYAKSKKHKEKFFKLMKEVVLEMKRKLRKWKYRILKYFGVDILKCEKCGAQMRFYDIVYEGESIREKLKKKILDDNKRKLKELVHTYGVIKGLINDKIEPLYI
jgi:hypothetical protein